MESTWSRPIPVSRAAWLRIGDSVFGVVQGSASALRRLWQSWQASRQHAAQLRALRELSPGVLRDIGVAPEWVNEAQRWHEQHSVARHNFLRGL